LADIFQMFSKVFYKSKIEDLDYGKIINMIDSIEYHKNDVVNDLSVPNINDASIDKKLLNKPEFKFLKDRIVNEFYKFKNEYLRYENNHFKMTTSWVSKTPKGKSSNMHNHNNCVYSGILYLNVNENSGNISFEDMSNKRFRIIPVEYNHLNSTEIRFSPEIGTIIFFPSEIHHKVMDNNSDIIRYSLAFNFMPEGEIGFENGDSYVNMRIID